MDRDHTRSLSSFYLFPFQILNVNFLNKKSEEDFFVISVNEP